MMRMLCSIELRPRKHSAALVRAALLTVAAINLLGCSQNKTVSLAECQTEADRFYQGYQTDDATNPRSQYITECMASKGYDLIFLRPNVIAVALCPPLNSLRITRKLKDIIEPICRV